MNERKQPQALTERIEPASDVEVGTHPSSIGVAYESSRLSPGSSNGSRHSVELHIEELVLHGFEPAHRYAIGDAIERELTRLFSEHGSSITATEDVGIAEVSGGAINVNSSAEATGVQLARAIYGGLAK